MCLPQKPKRREVRAKIHDSPLDHRLWLEDWPGSTEGREVRIGDALDCLFEQSVKPFERWMRPWWRTSHHIKDFWSSERCTPMYQRILQGNAILNLLMDFERSFERSSQRRFQVLSKTGPWNRGAPNRVVSAMSTLCVDYMHPGIQNLVCWSRLSVAASHKSDYCSSLLQNVCLCQRVIEFTVGVEPTIVLSLYR